MLLSKLQQGGHVSFRFSHTNSPRDAVKLRVGEYGADIASAKRRFVFVNGRNEWIEKYSHLPELLGIDPESDYLLTWDHRGQGASGGVRSHVEDYGDYTADMAAIIGDKLGDRPYKMICHSMGCLISAVALAKNQIRPAQIVWSSPFFALPESVLPSWVLFPTLWTAEKIRLGKLRIETDYKENEAFELNKLTHCRARYEAYQDHEYRDIKTTIGWLAASARAQQFIRMRSSIHSMVGSRVGIMCLAGTNEKVVGIKDLQRYMRQIKELSSDKTNRLSGDLYWIQGARHELFNEEDTYCEEALSHIKDFLLMQ